MHYLDPHFPYAPPPDYLDLFQNDEHWDGEDQIDIATDAKTRQMTGIGYGQVLDGRHELAFYVARYDAEIAYVDSEVGRLLDAVAYHGLDRRTLTVVTSDHGESLGEHHFYFDHGRFSFQTCARVPLIMHFPEAFEAREDFEPVELVDLAPTVLELAGAALAEGAWAQGRSLVPRLRGESVPEEHLAFTEAGHAVNRRWQRSVQDRRFKLMMVPNRATRRWISGKKFTLFDLEQDPGETEDVSERHPEARARLESALRGWFRERPLGEVEEKAPGEVVDQQTLEQLRALGYID